MALMRLVKVWSSSLSTRSSRRRLHEVTELALTQCDLLPLADKLVGSLSTGQRRLVELARCLAGPSKILLLDEHSSGLDRAETARFGEILKDAVRLRGVGVLIVEHDMTLVTDICDEIFVLDFGRPVFSGPPVEVMASTLVQAAYLGTIDSELILEQDGVTL